MGKFLSVYIHFPYCDVKCAYCDFYSLGKRNVDSSFFREYVSNLKKDFLKKQSQIPHSKVVRSIFLGGGTPSKVPSQYLQEIISFIKESTKISGNAEITLEANPESLTESKMRDYLKMGINRLSIGIQTSEPSLLRYLGRIYDRDSYTHILDRVQSAGFTNYNVDLIYGIPSQKEDHIRKDIDWAVSKNVKHISAYCLSVENSTLLMNQIRNGLKNPPSERRQGRHYEWVSSYLNRCGFLRYEISNFSKKGYECRHNLGYWRYQPYLGLGVASHSFTGNSRFVSEPNLQKYLKGNYFQEETEDKETRITDFFIGIFRILKYQSFHSIRKVLNESEFREFYGHLKKFQKKNWVEITKKGFQLTNHGARFSDTMVCEASAQE